MGLRLRELTMTVKAEAGGLRLSNYNMAGARLGVVVLMTPLVGLGIAFALLAIKEPVAYGVAAFLFLILIALWATVINLTWTIRLGERSVVVRRTFRLERRPLSDISRVRVRHIKSQFTRRAPWRYGLLVFEMSGGRPAQVLKPAGQTEEDLCLFLENHGIQVVNDDWVANGISAISRALLNGR
jgi:hypothetical protein